MKSNCARRFLAFCVFAVAAACPHLQAQMVWNHAASFDGTGYIAIPSSPSLNITGDFTIEAWIKTTSTGAVSIAGTNELRLLLDHGVGRIQFDNNTQLEGTKKINDGAWHHLACAYVHAGSYVAFAVDGVVDTSGSTTVTISSGTDSVIIGKSIYGSAPAALDEIRLWNRGQTLDEINTNMNMSLSAGTGVYSGLVLSLTFQSPNDQDFLLDVSDKSGKNNNGVNRGAGIVDMTNAPPAYLFPNMSLSLDGSGSYAVAPNDANIPNTGDFTLEAWIYPAKAASGAQQTILSRETSAYAGYEMYLLSDGKLALTTMDTFSEDTAAIPDNQWTHVAVTYAYNGTSATTMLFVNGRRNNAYNASPVSSVADSCYIGRSAAPARANYFQGYIDEVRLSGYAKTEAQIRQGMFTSIDYVNRLSTSSPELVYSFDGSAYPSTLRTPLLTLCGKAAFTSLANQSYPLAPLDREVSTGSAFPAGFSMRNAEKLITSGPPFTTAAFEDTLTVAESVQINDVKLFLGLDYGDESDLTITLYSPSGDSAVAWNQNWQHRVGSGIATVFDDNADSTMRSGNLSFSPVIKPYDPITPAFAGKNSAGAWRLRLYTDRNLFRGGLYGWGLQFNNVAVVGIQSGTAALPLSYELSQNYPNPFNPATVIQYRLAAAGDVSLKVYDILGREVATLVQGRETEGLHSVEFHGDNIASGVYFYRIRSGDFLSTRKMLLVK